MTRILLKIWYFFRNNINDLISLFVTVVITLTTYWFSDDQVRLLRSTIVLVLTSFAAYLVVKSLQRRFYYIFFDKQSDIEGWVGSGRFEYFPSNNAFVIRDSAHGYIFTKCLNWTNYKMSCDIKVVNNTLGVIIRASSASNKIMLQLNMSDQTIRPHYYANGGYLVAPIDKSLSFNNPLYEGIWYKLKMTVYHDDVHIQVIKGKDVAVDRYFKISTANLTFNVRKVDAKFGDMKDPIGAVDMTFEYGYGSVGFRNTKGEMALIKNFSVQKI